MKLFATLLCCLHFFIYKMRIQQIYKQALSTPLSLQGESRGDRTLSMLPRMWDDRLRLEWQLPKGLQPVLGFRMWHLYYLPPVNVPLGGRRYSELLVQVNSCLLPHNSTEQETLSSFPFY